ncbi:MAG: hypothetical protein K2X81_10995 [Candidatus Obscuribacterales bacterium]|nr:hypothetical protein [Candidatus Obscuribacterales bacterium]
MPLPFAFLLFAGAEAFQASNALLYAIIAQEVLGLGSFHLGATWFHFLDRDNRNYYFIDEKSRKLSFIIGSIFLYLASVLGQIYVAPILFFFYICWSLNHVVQQNIGILLLYQNNKTNEAKVPRNIQAWSQRLLVLCFSLLFFKRTILAGTPLAEFMWAPIAICAIAGLAFCIAYVTNLGMQLAAGKYLNLPGFVFWLVCVASFIPFGFLGKDYNAAAMIPLVVHWCQYIGLNYIVAERKYQEGQIDKLPVKRPIMLYLASGAFLVTIVTIMKFIDDSQGQNSILGNIIKGSVLGFSMVHYYQDGFLWRFRDKFPREAMLPYLIRH